MARPWPSPLMTCPVGHRRRRSPSAEGAARSAAGPRLPPGSPRTHKVHPPPDLSSTKHQLTATKKPPDGSTAHQR